MTHFLTPPSFSWGDTPPRSTFSSLYNHSLLVKLKFLLFPHYWSILILLYLLRQGPRPNMYLGLRPPNYVIVESHHWPCHHFFFNWLWSNSIHLVHLGLIQSNSLHFNPLGSILIQYISVHLLNNEKIQVWVKNWKYLFYI